jgi:hypothetical protein
MASTTWKVTYQYKNGETGISHITGPVALNRSYIASNLCNKLVPENVLLSSSPREAKICSAENRLNLYGYTITSIDES